MFLVIDSEGSPIQEFSALHVDEKDYDVKDVFHKYVKYPLHLHGDFDGFARRHVHGLNLSFLQENGLKDEEELRTQFMSWLESHPHSKIYGHAPQKEKEFLKMDIIDVELLPWILRGNTFSHSIAHWAKSRRIPVNGITCNAHTSFEGWKPRNPGTLTDADHQKILSGYHCSLYDCMETFLFQDVLSKREQIHVMNSFYFYRFRK